MISVLTVLYCSIADLLVLVICCPNGMIEMYMRRVSTIFYVQLTITLLFLTNCCRVLAKSCSFFSDFVSYLTFYDLEDFSGFIKNELWRQFLTYFGVTSLKRNEIDIH